MTGTRTRTRSRLGLALLALGALLTFVGFVVMGGQYGPAVLVVAVLALAGGTVLFGTAGGRTPERPTG